MAQGIDETLARIAGEIEQRRAEEPNCEKHPGNKARHCALCTEAEIAEINVRNAEEHRQRLAQLCDQGFPRRFVNAMADHPKVLEWVRSYVEHPEEAKGLLLMGATGTGKTYQAYGALRLVATHTAPYRTSDADPFEHWTKTTWTALTMADLNASMRPGEDRDPERTLTRNRYIDILLIDDLAAARSSEWVEEHIYRLINGRYEDMRPTIFTTNLEPAALRDALGDRIASRLAESCARVVLDGGDRRRQGQR